MEEGYQYKYEDLYDIVVALEIIEGLIEEGKSKEALRNVKALKEGFRRTLYPKGGE